MTTDLPQQLQTHRPLLLKFAMRQLRNPAWAEDAVSETLLAALAKPDGVRAAARSCARGWWAS
jgi:DNA-directed RNA polymerase specialized sigma24 family protein